MPVSPEPKKGFADEDRITFLKPEKRQPSEDRVPAIPHFSWQLPRIRVLENSLYSEVNTKTGRMTERGHACPTTIPELIARMTLYLFWIVAMDCRSWGRVTLVERQLSIEHFCKKPRQFKE